MKMLLSLQIFTRNLKTRIDVINFESQRKLKQAFAFCGD